MLPLIKILKDYINNNSTGFEEFLLGIDKKKKKLKKNDDEEKHIKKKRNRHMDDEDLQNEIDPCEVYRILDNTDEKQEDMNKRDISINEKFDVITEIIENLQNCFNYTFNNEFILDALKMNSMNIKRTYDFLSDPNGYKGKLNLLN